MSKRFAIVTGASSGELQPYTSVLIVLGHSDAARRQRVLDRVRGAKPVILESDLPVDLEEGIKRELREV